MSQTNLQIVAALKSSEQSASNLALITGKCEASIRRSLKELRAQGFNISFGPSYKLGS